MKTYPLEVKSVGADMYCVMSRGHHDLETFMTAVREKFPNWPMGAPKHVWMRCVPDSNGEFRLTYVPARPRSRGAFPVTWTNEDYSKAWPSSGAQGA